jgi:hypothetical protein
VTIGCHSCRTLRFVKCPEFKLPNTAVYENVELPDLMHRVFVDSDIGLISVLDEGTLLQYPRHQCAARLNRAVAPFWITDSGQDMQEARRNVIQRTLEVLVSFVLRDQCSPDVSPVHLMADVMLSSTRMSVPTDGLVVSAMSARDLWREAFYRLSAHRAMLIDRWSALDAPREVPHSPQVDLLLGYLADISDLALLSVEVAGESKEKCRILRFGWAGKAVSLVAGTQLDLIWTMGLQDVCLELAAKDSLAEYSALNNHETRLRAAYDSDDQDFYANAPQGDAPVPFLLPINSDVLAMLPVCVACACLPA